jgi:hypothetical protein
MNRAHGRRGVQYLWWNLAAGLCMMLTAGPLSAQKTDTDPSLYAFKDGPAPLWSEPTRGVRIETEGTLVTTSNLPESPKRNQTDVPAFDSLRLTSSTSLDEDDDTPALKPPKFTVNADAVAGRHNAVRMPSRNSEPRTDDDHAAMLARELDEPWRYEKYHWRGLIAQSHIFNAVETSFRLANDDQIRYLVARKPFWHDYFASMRQYNMHRWNDGDEFLVNYIGHPMQGAVAGYIEIQNDPTGRQQELSATHDYWMSRFRAFLWSTAFSAHSEISPLGEAGIGNEGGWTYPRGDCHRPCKQYDPKTWTYTNNTGWVDFIITPTVGALWTLAEDTIDRYVSDRIQGDNRSAAFPLIVRGALNPSRTFANAMRFKTPWYRDFQHGLPPDKSRKGIHMLASDEEIARAKTIRRISVAAHYRSTPFGSANNHCALCLASPGAGFEADYAITRWISASLSFDKQQGLITPKNLLAKGNPNVDDSSSSTAIAGFGVRLVYDRPQNTFSLAIRPGFVNEQIQVPPVLDTVRGMYSEPLTYTVNHTAASLTLSNDYKVNRTLAIRSSFGATIVRYRTATRDPDGIGKPPYLSFLSHENFTNHTTWTWQGGPVIHF